MGPPGFEPARAKNRDEQQAQIGFDSSRVSSRNQERRASRHIPPKPAVTPEPRNGFASQIGGAKMQERVCLVCKHHECSACVEDHGKLGLWVTCCQCGFGALASFWNPEACEQITQVISGREVCQYCGHLRCETCEPNLWPRLADGYCSCVARSHSTRSSKAKSYRMSAFPILTGASSSTCDSICDASISVSAGTMSNNNSSAVTS